MKCAAAAAATTTTTTATVTFFGLLLGFIVASYWHWFPSEVYPVCLLKCWPIRIGVRISQLPSRRFLDLRFRRSAIWGRALIGWFLSFVGVFFPRNWSAGFSFPFIWNKLNRTISKRNTVPLSEPRPYKPVDNLISRDDFGRVQMWRCFPNFLSGWHSVVNLCVGHVRKPCKNGWFDRDAVWVWFRWAIKTMY